jgi:hypothetical protein
MSIYDITRIVQEDYRIEANSRDEAIRKLNRATPWSAVTKKLTVGIPREAEPAGAVCENYQKQVRKGRKT